MNIMVYIVFISSLSGYDFKAITTNIILAVVTVTINGNIIIAIIIINIIIMIVFTVIISTMFVSVCAVLLI